MNISSPALILRFYEVEPTAEFLKTLRNIQNVDKQNEPLT